MADKIGIELTGDNAKFASMLDHSTSLVGRFNGVLNTLGLGISVGATVSFFKKIADEAGKLVDLSDRLEVGTAALQGFDYAARMAGATSEQATAVWERAKKSIDALISGDEAAAKMFSRIGLSAKDFLGLNLEQGLEAIARGYVATANTAGSYDAITDILGSKSAPKLNTVLKQLGEEGFEAVKRGATEAGQATRDEFLKVIDTAGDNLEVVKKKTTVWGQTALAVGLIWSDMPKTLAKIVEKATGIDLPFVNAGKSAKQAAEDAGKLPPIIDELTKQGEKSVLQDIERTKQSREHLQRSERLLLLKQDEANLENALAQAGVTRGVQEAINLSLTETRKQIRVEEKAIAGDEEKHRARMVEMTAKEIEARRSRLQLEEQLKEYRQDEAGWLAVLADHAISQEVRNNAELELAKTRGKIREIEKKHAVEMAAAETIRGEQVRSATETESERTKALSDQEKLLNINSEIVTLSKIPAKDLTSADVERLRVLEMQKRQLMDQMAAVEKIASVTRSGNSYNQQSDDSLEGVRNRLRSQIAQIQRDDFGRPGGVGGKGKPAELYLLESELANLEKEANQRKEVRDYASRFGEAKARQQFGDTLTEKAIRDWSNDTTAMKVGIQDLAARFAKLFPNP